MVGAALFQPVERHMKPFDENSFNEKKMLLQPCQHKRVDTSDTELDIEDIEEDKCELETQSIDSTEVFFAKKPSWQARLTKAMDLQLLNDPIFISIAIGLALAYTASINFSMLFPYFLQVKQNTLKYFSVIKTFRSFCCRRLLVCRAPIQPCACQF